MRQDRTFLVFLRARSVRPTWLVVWAGFLDLGSRAGHNPGSRSGSIVSPSRQSAAAASRGGVPPPLRACFPARPARPLAGTFARLLRVVAQSAATVPVGSASSPLPPVQSPGQVAPDCGSVVAGLPDRVPTRPCRPAGLCSRALKFRVPRRQSRRRAAWAPALVVLARVVLWLPFRGSAVPLLWFLLRRLSELLTSGAELAPLQTTPCHVG